MDHSRKQVEQFEVIERRIVETRRPITNEQALNYVPTSYTQTSTENFVRKDPIRQSDSATYDIGSIPPTNNEAVDRFYLTGEREKDTSILYTSNQSPIAERLFTSGKEQSYSSGINNYGYDLHEIQTLGGGARIVQTHGSGNSFENENLKVLDHNLNDSSFIAHDRSLNNTILQSAGNSASRLPQDFVDFRETISKEIDYRKTALSPNVTTASGNLFSSGIGAATNNSRISDSLHPILKNSDSWKQFSSTEDNSLSRKDSYKRMQEKQPENTSLYAGSSNVGTLNSKSSQKQWILSGMQDKRNFSNNNNCWDSTKLFFIKTFEEIREANWTPRLVGTMLCAFFLIFLFITILWLIFSSVFSSFVTREYLLYPPLCEECIKNNPSAVTYHAPSKLYVHLSSPGQAHFELLGNLPFKSSSFLAVDFTTGFVAIADHALTDSTGRQTTCFIMELDRSTLPSMSVLVDALDNTYYHVKTQFGWQEYWQYNAEAVDEHFANDRFTDRIEDCKAAKWYFLKHTVYTKDSSCSTCYDFCLPDYAILRRQKYEDEPSLSVRRLNCFRLYVPEWSGFSIETDESGGHWKYPKQQTHQYYDYNEKQSIQRRQTHNSQRDQQNLFEKNRIHYNLVGNWIDTDKI